jgi:DNA-binding NarL/FixJ family response regulator
VLKALGVQNSSNAQAVRALVEGTVMQTKTADHPDTAGESSSSALRIVVAEDEVLLREALCSLLVRCGFDVVGQAGSKPELLTQVRALQPDLVVVDIRMPPTHTTEGLDAARIIREEQPNTGIMVLSAHLDVDHAMDLMINGSKGGYLLKSRVADVADFIDALQRIAKGASVVDPSMMKEVLIGRRQEDPLDTLSPREQQVLALMAEGRSNVGIARRLRLAEATVEKHVRSILTKLNLAQTDDDHRRVRAVLTYLKDG